MFGSLRTMAAKNWILAIVGVALIASVSFAGWKYWPANLVGDSVQVSPPIVSVQPAPIVQPVEVTKLVRNAGTALVAADDTATSPGEPATNSAKPTGKKHEREENLLAVMAMRLHSDAYERFIRQKGFGMGRIVPMLSVVKREWKKPDWTSEELAKGQGEIKGAKDLSLLHLSNVNFFLDSNTKTDKERYASISNSGPAKKEFVWEIKSLDLIGLVVHETPTVYISEKLPEMKDLAHRPTREMDVFEMEGLEELMTGKDLYIRGKDDTIRVLGPVRASKACLKCHSDAKDGQMLGAFSYTLRLGQYQMHGRGVSPAPGVAPNGLTPQVPQQLRQGNPDPIP